MLFTPSGITKGVISVQINSNIKLQIPISIEIIEEDVEIPEEMLENIKERKMTYYYERKKKKRKYNLREEEMFQEYPVLFFTF